VVALEQYRQFPQVAFANLRHQCFIADIHWIRRGPASLPAHVKEYRAFGEGLRTIPAAFGANQIRPAGTCRSLMRV
jgi:hypothetical protein